MPAGLKEVQEPEVLAAVNDAIAGVIGRVIFKPNQDKKFVVISTPSGRPSFVERLEAESLRDAEKMMFKIVRG